MKLSKTDPQRGMAIVVLTIVMPLSFLLSCGGEKNETIEYVFDPETSYTLKEKNVNTLISDSGFTRYKIIADTWLRFEKASEPYMLFPDGGHLERFDTLLNIEASIKADTAYYYERQKLWELINHVEASNFEGTRFETSHLFMDQNKGTIYSDSFICVTMADGMIQKGHGFTSNENLTIYQIYNAASDIPFEKRSRSPRDSMAIDSASIDSMPAVDSITVDSIIPAVANTPATLSSKPDSTPN